MPKVIEALDQSITMYNLVNVCAFCAQYFDPDFPDGIASPQREHVDVSGRKPNHKSDVKYFDVCILTFQYIETN